MADPQPRSDLADPSEPSGSADLSERSGPAGLSSVAVLAALERAVPTWPTTAAVAVTTAVATVASVGDSRASRPWASVTKLLTALATLVAVEEGTVGLDQPAGPAGSTVRHLLAHASGLGPDSDRVVTAPGTRRIYSNRGFEVLGAALEAAAGMPWSDYVTAGVLEPLAMASTQVAGSPASGATGPLDDLVALARELQAPTLVSPETMALATDVAFPGLDGVLPGFGRQRPNDWGLGFERRGTKQPHWTGTVNSPATFGHFGRAGSFLWVDPEIGLACVELADRPFGPWAAAAWPELADAVIAAAGPGAQTDRR